MGICLRSLERRRYYSTLVPERLVLESGSLCDCILCGHFLLPAPLLHPYNGYLLLQPRNRKHLQGNRPKHFRALLRQRYGCGLYLCVLHCYLQQLSEKCLHWRRTPGVALPNNDGLYLPALCFRGDCLDDVVLRDCEVQL